MNKTVFTLLTVTVLICGICSRSKAEDFGAASFGGTETAANPGGSFDAGRWSNTATPAGSTEVTSATPEQTTIDNGETILRIQSAGTETLPPSNPLSAIPEANTIDVYQNLWDTKTTWTDSTIIGDPIKYQKGDNTIVLFPFQIPEQESGFVQIAADYAADTTNIAYLVKNSQTPGGFEYIQAQTYAGAGIFWQEDIQSTGDVETYNHLSMKIGALYVNSLYSYATETKGLEFDNPNQRPLIKSNDPAFIDAVNQALNLLEKRSLKSYHLVCQNILIISPQIASGSAVALRTATLSSRGIDRTGILALNYVTTQNININDLQYLCGDLTHEAQHQNDYKVNPQTDACTREINAQGAETEALQNIGAPNGIIQNELNQTKLLRKNDQNSYTIKQWVNKETPYFALLTPAATADLFR